MMQKEKKSKNELNTSKKIRVFGIVKESIVDGPGLRYVVFTQGCLFHCEDCHNKESWDLDKGYFVEINDIIKEIRQNPLLRGLTLSGGEPTLQAKMCLDLARRVRKMGLDVVLYSGHTYEEIIINKDLSKLINECDYLIDGKYDHSMRSLCLLFRGSTNQRIIDLNKTRKNSNVTLYNIEIEQSI